MQPKTAIHKSKHKDEIDDMLLSGVSARKVSEYLSETYNEKISNVSISNYNNKYLNVLDKAKKKHQRKKQQEYRKISKVVDEKVNTIEKVDNVSDEVANALDILHSKGITLLKVNLNSTKLKPDENTTELDIEKHRLNEVKAGSQLIKVYSDIMKDEPETPDVNVFNLNGFDEDELKLAKEIAQKIAEPENYEEFDESVDSEDIS